MDTMTDTDIWELHSATEGPRGDRWSINQALADGWEPFAITQRSSGGLTYHFKRRKADPSDG